MDPKILYLANELLDKYLSYSECELKEILNKDVSSFWKDVCSTVNLTAEERFSLNDIILEQNFIKRGFLLDSNQLSELNELLIEYPMKSASNDELFDDYFEVAA